MCFGDYEKVFDVVKHEGLIKVLKQINADVKDINVITTVLLESAGSFENREQDDSMEA